MNNEINLPNHVGIIMDGNGRWAEKRGLKRSLGHKAGSDNLEKLGEGAYKIMDKLAEFIVDKSKPIFEIWMPKVLDNLRAVFMSDENRKILADIGEVVAGAVIIGFGLVHDVI